MREGHCRHSLRSTRQHRLQTVGARGVSNADVNADGVLLHLGFTSARGGRATRAAQKQLDAVDMDGRIVVQALDAVGNDAPNSGSPNSGTPNSGTPVSIGAWNSGRRIGAQDSGVSTPGRSGRKTSKAKVGFGDPDEMSDRTDRSSAMTLLGYLPGTIVMVGTGCGDFQDQDRVWFKGGEDEGAGLFDCDFAHVRHRSVRSHLERIADGDVPNAMETHHLASMVSYVQEHAHLIVMSHDLISLSGSSDSNEVEQLGQKMSVRVSQITSFHRA